MQSIKPDPKTQSYTMKFDSVEAIISALIPPEHRKNYRNIQISADGFNLKVDADVQLSAFPGFDMFAAPGWSHVTGRGPVSVLRPGALGWDLQVVELNGRPMMAMLWAPLVRRATGRSDTILPVPVAPWVRRVRVEQTALVLYKT